MIAENDTISSLNYYLANSLNLDISKLMTRDFSNSYPWMNNPELFCSFDHKSDKAYVVYRDEEKNWLQLNNEANHKKLFQMMSAAVSFYDFQSKKDLRQFSEALYQLSDDPRKEILDDTFLQRNGAILFSYLKAGGKSEMELRQACSPLMVVKKGMGYTVNFNLLNSNGSVSKWTVLVENTIQSIHISQIHEPGSYYFPNEY
jgi:hypothetical protein